MEAFLRGDGGDVRPANRTQTFCQEDRQVRILVVVVVRANEELGIDKSGVRGARVHTFGRAAESANRTAGSVGYYIIEIIF